MLIEFLCLVYYITSSIETIPAVYRIYKRRSSEDYSLVSTYISLVGTVCWSIYIYATKQTFIVYVGTAFDLLVSVIYTYFVVRFHKVVSGGI